METESERDQMESRTNQIESRPKQMESQKNPTDNQMKSPKKNLQKTSENPIDSLRQAIGSASSSGDHGIITTNRNGKVAVLNAVRSVVNVMISPQESSSPPHSGTQERMQVQEAQNEVQSSVENDDQQSGSPEQVRAPAPLQLNLGRPQGPRPVTISQFIHPRPAQQRHNPQNPQFKHHNSGAASLLRPTSQFFREGSKNSDPFGSISSKEKSTIQGGKWLKNGNRFTPAAKKETHFTPNPLPKKGNTLAAAAQRARGSLRGDSLEGSVKSDIVKKGETVKKGGGSAKGGSNKALTSSLVLTMPVAKCCENNSANDCVDGNRVNHLSECGGLLKKLSARFDGLTIEDKGVGVTVGATVGVQVENDRNGDNHNDNRNDIIGQNDNNVVMEEQLLVDNSLSSDPKLKSGSDQKFKSGLMQSGLIQPGFNLNQISSLTPDDRVDHLYNLNNHQAGGLVGSPGGDSGTSSSDSLMVMRNDNLTLNRNDNRDNLNRNDNRGFPVMTLRRPSNEGDQNRHLQRPGPGAFPPVSGIIIVPTQHFQNFRGPMSSPSVSGGSNDRSSNDRSGNDWMESRDSRNENNNGPQSDSGPDHNNGPWSNVDGPQHHFFGWNDYVNGVHPNQLNQPNNGGNRLRLNLLESSSADSQLQNQLMQLNEVRFNDVVNSVGLASETDYATQMSSTLSNGRTDGAHMQINHMQNINGPQINGPQVDNQGAQVDNQGAQVDNANLMMVDYGDFNLNANLNANNNVVGDENEFNPFVLQLNQVPSGSSGSSGSQASGGSKGK
jgi:hypothetical protein